jgi:ParB family transcriptional regulator, chromosome partitioning protein
LATGFKQYLRPDLIPEYIDISLIKHSRLNARLSLSNIDALMNSIRENGLLQPILVRLSKQKFEVVAGNRRLEACRRLHWVKIPCLVREFSDKEAYEVGLVENLERETLSPVEEARAFKLYASERGWGGIKELAKKVGRSQEYISHRIALLSLPNTVIEMIEEQRITPSAGHELVWMKDPEGQAELAQAIAGRKVPAKQVREAVMMLRDGTSFDDAISGINVKLEHGSRSRSRNPNKFLRLLDKSILVLRICILRLDSIIEELESEDSYETLRQILIKKRLAVHNQIDDLLQLKKSAPRL